MHFLAIWLIVLLFFLIISTFQISKMNLKFGTSNLDPPYSFSRLMNPMMSKFRLIFGSLNFPPGCTFETE